VGPRFRGDDKKNLEPSWTPTTSLLDRANLDAISVRHQVARALRGADDGRAVPEYAQTEALMFDNGRLKQATYDTSQGFGLRRGEGRRGWLCAFLGRFAAGADPGGGRGRRRARRLLAGILPRHPRTPMCGSMATKIRSMPLASNRR